MREVSRLKAGLALALLLAVMGGIGIMAALISAGVDGNAVGIVGTVVTALLSPLGQSWRHLFPTADEQTTPSEGVEK